MVFLSAKIDNRHWPGCQISLWNCKTPNWIYLDLFSSYCFVLLYDMEISSIIHHVETGSSCLVRLLIGSQPLPVSLIICFPLFLSHKQKFHWVFCFYLSLSSLKNGILAYKEWYNIGTVENLRPYGLVKPWTISSPASLHSSAHWLPFHFHTAQ